MTRFKKILVVAQRDSDNESVMNRALSLARENRAQIKVVDVVKHIPEEMRGLATTFNINEIEEMVINDCKAGLERIAGPYREKGVDITTEVLVGTPFLGIIHEVQLNNHDLVMTTAGDRSDLKEMIFGSTSMHLIRKCPCPVWVIKRSHLEGFSQIMAAVDLLPPDDERNRLNTKIMDLAVSLAVSEGTTLHIIHAWLLYGERILKNRISRDELNAMLDETKMLHKKWLDDLVEPYLTRMPDIQVHLLKGEAKILIPRLASERQVSLIVMGTVGRIGVPGLFIGNTAEKILQQVDCSVLAVKPDKFVSPVIPDLDDLSLLKSVRGRV